MKNFIEVTVFDNYENNQRAIIPIDNIAYIAEEEGHPKLYLKEGNVISVTVLQTFDQILFLLK